jgi:hypothetical protein
MPPAMTQARLNVVSQMILVAFQGVREAVGVMCRSVLSETRPVGERSEYGIVAAAIRQADATPA